MTASEMVLVPIPREKAEAFIAGKSRGAVAVRRSVKAALDTDREKLIEDLGLAGAGGWTFTRQNWDRLPRQDRDFIRDRGRAILAVLERINQEGESE